MRLGERGQHRRRGAGWRRRALIAVAVLSTAAAAAIVAWNAISNGTAAVASGSNATDPVSPGGPTPSASPTPSPTPSVPADAAIPRRGDGTFQALDAGGPVVGSGTKLVRYRVEVERGIAWGGLIPWTPASFATTVDGILAAPLGWTWSAQHPVTDTKVHLNKASWRFQRVAGNAYEVRIRLTTPDTVDRVCGQAGLDTDGVYSCRVGNTILVNLRRWLQGAAGFPVTIEEYRTSVINHEVGHFLGFDHMKCPGPGQPAPVMSTQTRELGGCVPNAYPFEADGTFISGPWQPS